MYALFMFLFFYSLFVPVSLYSQQVRNPLFLTGVYLNDDHFRDVTLARHKCFFVFGREQKSILERNMLMSSSKIKFHPVLRQI
jgi:hypothetical protein